MKKLLNFLIFVMVILLLLTGIYFIFLPEEASSGSSSSVMSTSHVQESISETSDISSETEAPIRTSVYFIPKKVEAQLYIQPAVALGDLNGQSPDRIESRLYSVSIVGGKRETLTLVASETSDVETTVETITQNQAKISAASLGYDCFVLGADLPIEANQSYKVQATVFFEETSIETEKVAYRLEV